MRLKKRLRVLLHGESESTPKIDMTGVGPDPCAATVCRPATEQTFLVRKHLPDAKACIVDVEFA